MENKSNNIIYILGEDSPKFFQNQIGSEWLLPREAANYLRVTDDAFRMMVYRRKIKKSKLGGRNRYHISDLRALLKEDRR